jgi:hypothetical protein
MFLFSFISLSSLQLLVLPSTPFLLFNFFSKVLIWENFYVILLDGVVKILRRIKSREKILKSSFEFEYLRKLVHINCAMVLLDRG